MRIVILSDDFPPYILGGAGIIAWNHSRGMLNLGHDVYVITIVDSIEKSGKSSQDGIVVYRVYDEYNLKLRSYLSLYNHKVLNEIKNIFNEIKPDVVHAHNIHTHISYASLRLAKKYTKAVYITMHDVMSVNYGKLGARVDSLGKVIPDSISPFKQIKDFRFQYNPFRNFIIKYYLGFTTKIFSVSGPVKNILEKKGIHPVSVLHNSIDVSKWDIEPKFVGVFKEQHGLVGKKVLFFGGRLSSAKGGLIAIEALSEVLKFVNSAVLLVVGEKNQSVDKMLSFAEKYNVKDKIVFTGWIDHSKIKYAYGSSDVVLVLSQYIDPFPTVNLEAMASKKPVIGTKLGGTSEIVVDNQTGFLVNPFDVHEISHKIIELIKYPDKSLRFGEEGFRIISNNYKENDWANKMVECYNEALKI